MCFCFVFFLRIEELNVKWFSSFLFKVFKSIALNFV